MCPPRVMDSDRGEERGAEEKAEVCSATQSEGVSEEVGAMGGERLGLLGRARAALRHGSHICDTSDSEKPIFSFCSVLTYMRRSRPARLNLRHSGWQP